MQEMWRRKRRKRREDREEEKGGVGSELKEKFFF